jgi:hypothetical protein
LQWHLSRDRERARERERGRERERERATETEAERSSSYGRAGEALKRADKCGMRLGIGRVRERRRF